MQRAIADAARTLPKALEVTQTGGRGFSPALNLKFTFQNPQGGEHIWVNTVKRAGAGFSGKLANQPRSSAGKSMGSTVRFDQGAIMDWSIEGSDGRMFGH